MNKHNKHNKAYDEFLHYRGSKTAKQSRQGYYNYDVISAIFKDRHNKSKTKNNDSKDKTKHINKYRRTQESDIECENTRHDEYGHDYYGQPKYKKDDKKSNYSPERDLRQRTLSYISRYQPSETGGVSEYDLDSDYLQWEIPRGMGKSYYTYKEQYSRESNFCNGHRKHPLDQRDVDVYTVDLPRGQNPYRDKQKRRKLSDYCNDEASPKGLTGKYTEISHYQRDADVYAKEQYSREINFHKGQRRHSKDITDTESNHYERDVDLYAAELPRGQNPYREKWKESKCSENNNETFWRDQRRHSRDITDTESNYYGRDVDVYAAELPRGQTPYMEKWKESKFSDDNYYETFRRGQRRHSRDITDTESNHYERDVDLYAAELPRGQNPYREKWKESKCSDNNNETFWRDQRRHSRDITDTESNHYGRDVDVYAAELLRGQTPYREKWKESKFSDDNNDETYRKDQRRHSRHSRDITDNQSIHYGRDVDVYATELPRDQNPYGEKWKESKFSDDKNDETYRKDQRRHSRDITDTQSNHYGRDVDVYVAELPSQNHHKDKRKESKLSDDKNNEAYRRCQRRRSRDTKDTERSYYKRDVDVHAAELPRGQNTYRDKRKEHKFSDDINHEARQRGQRRNPPDTNKTERSQYRSNVDVYAAELCRGQNSCKYKQKERKLSDDNNDEASLKGQRDQRRHPQDMNPYRYKWKESKLSDDTNHECPSKTEVQQTHRHSEPTALQSEQVYTTSNIPNNTAFSQEKIISVVEYNADIPPLKQKHKNTFDVNIHSSEIVYVPVIFQYKPNTKQKITSTKLKLEKPKYEEPLNNNIEVFVAGNLEQENIFQQSPNAKHKKRSTSVKEKSNIPKHIEQSPSVKDKSNIPKHIEQSPSVKEKFNIPKHIEQSPSVKDKSNIPKHIEQSPSVKEKFNIPKHIDQSPSVKEKSNIPKYIEQSPSIKEKSKIPKHIEQSPSANEKSKIPKQIEQSPSVKEKSNIPKYIEQSPSVKDKSNFSTSFKSLMSNMSELKVNETEYPVKKSYINVATNNKSQLEYKSPETETQKTQRYSETTASRSTHQLYITSKIPSNTSSSREILISVIDYSSHTQPLQQEYKNNLSTNENSSVFAHSSVTFQDEPSPTQNNHPSKLQLKEHKDEEPMKNNFQVFVAGNLQENVFEQSNNVKKEEQSSSVKEKANISTAVKSSMTDKSILDVNKTEYPVKKSYINVTRNHISQLKYLFPESKGSKFLINAFEEKKQNKGCRVEKNNRGSMVQEYIQTGFTQDKINNQDGSTTKSPIFCVKTSLSNVSYANQNHNKETQTTGILQDQGQTSKSKQLATTSVISDQKSYSGDIHHMSSMGTNEKKYQYSGVKKKSGNFTDKKKIAIRKQPQNCLNCM